MINFKVEKLSGVIDECQPLINKHWEEIALNKDSIPLDPDWGLYEQIEAAGNLFIVTARSVELLVGYSVYFISNNLHYKNLRVAESDIFWLDPNWRRGSTGIKLLKASEGFLKSDGVDMIMSKVKLHNDVGVVFERLGYTPIERVYSKRIS